MTFSYGARLASLCFASFFIVQLLAGLLVSALVPNAVGWAGQMNARWAARVLFALRMTPLLCGVCAVGALVVPSYLWLEPAAIEEPVSWLCMLIAALGSAVCGASVCRAVRAMQASAAYIRYCRRTEQRLELPGDGSPALIVESVTGIALAGMIRPQLVISAAALRVLTAEQIAAAVRHERAHQCTRDNWKRLFMLLAPRLAFWTRRYEALDRAWARFAEWAADDRAARGSAEQRVVLAEALVRVARVSTGVHPALVNSFAAEPGEVAVRVERLLGCRACQGQIDAPISTRLLAAALGIFVLAAALIQHTNLATIHLLLERFMH